MIHFEDDIEDDYDVLDGGVFSEAEEDNDIDKPSKHFGEEEDKETKGGEKKKKAVKQGAVRRIAKKPKLDADRLCGTRGILAVQDTFKNVNLKGKGHEKADLDLIISKMEHWAHRLFPQLPFKDCIEQVAKVGSNRAVQVYLKRFRSDMIGDEKIDAEEPADMGDNLEEFARSPPQASGEQLFNQLMADMCNTSASTSLVSLEQQERMAENKRRAEEKRKSRLLNASALQNSSAVEFNTSLPCQEPLESENTSKKTNPKLYEVTVDAEDVNAEDVVAIDDMLDDL